MRDLFLYVHVQIFSLQKHCYFKINRICPCCAKSWDIHVCVCVCVCSAERERCSSIILYQSTLLGIVVYVFMISLHFLFVCSLNRRTGRYMRRWTAWQKMLGQYCHCVWTRRFQFSLSRFQGWELVSLFSLSFFFLVFADSLWYNRNGWRGVKHHVTYLLVFATAQCFLLFLHWSMLLPQNSNGQPGDLDKGWGLHQVLHVTPTAFLPALLHGATAAFLLLWRRGRTTKCALGTAVLFGVGNLQYVPALVTTCCDSVQS